MTTVRTSPTEQLRPVGASEAATMVREIGAGEGHLNIGGGGSGQGWLPEPLAGATRLNTRGLDKITEYDPADLTVTVEAGCTLDSLQETLRGGGQFLPVDYSPSGTVGGLVATAAWGRTSPGGAIRDRILGVSAINAGGDLTRCGSRVVKSVAGFDLAKLYCGSFGTLALITEVTFKVAPLPPARAGLSLGGELDEVLEFCTRTLRSGFAPASIHVVRPCRADLRHDDAAEWSVELELAGRPSVVERLGRELFELGASLGLVRDQSEDSNRGAGGDHGKDVTVIQQPPSLLKLTLEQLPPECAVVADGASGCTVVEGIDGMTLDRVWKSISEAGGALRRRTAAGVEWRRALDPGAAALARRVKQALDPGDILNRGLLGHLL